MSGAHISLQEVMRQKVFAVAGDTLNPEKYAHRIKQGLLEHGYTVYAVGKELASFNDIPSGIDVIVLCVHPAKGLRLMQECARQCMCVVIQPGAESDELLAYLDRRQQPYIQGCVLVGLSVYAKDKSQPPTAPRCT